MQGAIDACLLAAGAAPDFREVLRAHLQARAAITCQRPACSPAGLGLAIAAAHRHDAERLPSLVVGAIAYHGALDAIDDFQDGDAPLWEGLSPEGVLNLGLALQFCALAAFRQAGCSPGFFERLDALAIETAAGQAADLAYRPADLAGISEAAYLRVLSRKTGATFELYARAACEVCENADTDRLAAWGRALGVYLEVVADTEDAAQEASPDLCRGKPSLPLLHALGCSETDARTSLLEDLAGYRDSAEARARVRDRLHACGSFEYAAARARELGNALAADLADLVAEPHRPAFRSLIYNADAPTGAAAPLAPAPPGPPDEVLAARAAEAVAALEASPLQPEGWDVHRWGLQGHGELVGDVFPVALVASALAACGCDVSAARERLLARAGPEGWRYFPEMPELPPDSDVLGQVLQVLAGFPAPEAEPAIATLLGHIDSSGALPTWLEAPQEADSPWWAGNECIAAVANAYYGLLRYDADRFASVVSRGLPYLLDHLDEHDDWKSFWYIPAYARYACARLLAGAHRVLTLPPDLAARVAGALARTRELAAPEADPGSIAPGPLRIALALCTQAAAHESGFVRPAGEAGSPDPAGLAASLGPGLRLLVDSQRVDGLWSAWPLYLVPARGGTFTWYGSRSVTTAFCLRALRLNLGFTWV